MWNQSKRILYILLFIHVPQVIVSIVFPGIYANPNTYLSGMYVCLKLNCNANLNLKCIWPLVFYHIFLQSLLPKLLVLLFARYHSAVPHHSYYHGAFKLWLSDSCLVLCF